jgi:MFS family permease
MTVVRWFRRRRGLALGIASSGASCGILVVPMIAAFIIDRWDWRMGLLVLGAVLLVVTNAAARFMVADPAYKGLVPDGAAGASESHSGGVSAVAEAASDWTFREARRTLSFWMFLVGFAIVLLTMTVPFVHIAVFAHDIGLAGMAGAATVSTIGLFSLIGSVTLGAVSDRIGRKPAFVIALVCQIAAYSLFLKAGEITALYAGAAAFGYFYGGFASLFPALVAQMFGHANAGTIGGFIIGGAGLLGAWGPALAGYLRDVHGDYRFAFALCLATAIVALVLFVLLPRPRRS